MGGGRQVRPSPALMQPPGPQAPLTRTGLRCPPAGWPAASGWCCWGPGPGCASRWCTPPCRPWPGPYDSTRCDPHGRAPQPQARPLLSRDAPLEVPGEAQGDVGAAVIQFPFHLRPAWRADAPECPGAPLDLRRDDVLGAVLADELHGQLGGGRHLSGAQPGPLPPLRLRLGALTGWGSNCLDSSS